MSYRYLVTATLPDSSDVDDATSRLLQHGIGVTDWTPTGPASNSFCAHVDLEAPSVKDGFAVARERVRSVLTEGGYSLVVVGDIAFVGFGR